MSAEGYCFQIDSNSFSVSSQTNPENRYKVSITDNGLICECLDHITRGSDRKHIKIVLNLIKNNQCERNNIFRITDRSNFKTCKFCSSDNIIKKDLKKIKPKQCKCSCAKIVKKDLLQILDLKK